MDLSILTAEQRAAFDAAVAIWSTANPTGDHSALLKLPLSRWHEVSDDLLDEFSARARLGSDDTLVNDIVSEVEDQVATDATCTKTELVTKVEAVADWRPEFKNRVLAHAKALGWTPAATTTPPPPTPPTITKATPNTGVETGGTKITITGTGFENGATVTFGGADGKNPNVVSATEIKVEVPIHSPGAVDIVVTNPDGQTATLAGGFTYAKKPNGSGGSTVGGSGGAKGGSKPTATLDPRVAGLDATTRTNYEYGLQAIKNALEAVASGDLREAMRIVDFVKDHPHHYGGSVAVSLLNEYFRARLQLVNGGSLDTVKVRFGAT